MIPPAWSQASGKSGKTGRSDRIRTCDPFPPREVRYRAALRSDGRGYNTALWGAKALFALVVGAKQLAGSAQFGEREAQGLDL